MAKKKRRKNAPTKLSIDVIEARVLVLVDEFGTERVSVSCSGGEGGQGGSTVFHIKDDDGCPRLTLQVDCRGNPSVLLSTPNGGAGVSMAVNADRGNGFAIGDSAGRPLIQMGVPGEKSEDPRGPHPSIDVLDKNGGRGWSVFGGAYQLPHADEASAPP